MENFIEETLTLYCTSMQYNVTVSSIKFSYTTYTEPDSDALKYDVHFWIGKYSTQEEYGTAAYKTVELDTFLYDKAILHREVQGHETDLFKSYFKSKNLYI